MLIRCPNCDAECETEVELAPGQHVLCPFCETKFCYTPQETTVENAQEEMPQMAENRTEGSTIKIMCPYCGAGYEVDSGYEGEIATCGTCDKKFLMQVEKKEEPFLPSQLQNSSSAGESKVVPKLDSKHVLKPVAKPVLKPVVQRGLSAIPPQKKAGGGKRFFIKKKKRFCRECGSELSPVKPQCPKCGAMSIAESSSVRISRMSGDGSNHVGMAICAIVLFFPLGIIALVFALQAQSRRAFGDDYGAEDAARTAHACAKIGIILGSIGLTLWFFVWLYTYQNMIREQRELERTIQSIQSIYY